MDGGGTEGDHGKEEIGRLTLFGPRFGNIAVDLLPPLVTDHVARVTKDALSVSGLEGVGLADDLDNFGFEFLFGEEEAFPKLIADLTALQQSREGGFGVTDGPDQLDVVHRAAEEGRDEDGTRRRRVEREQRDVDVTRLVRREPWLGLGLGCR